MPKSLVPRMLVAYSMSSTHVQTTLDYLESFKKHIGYEVRYLHVTDGAEVVEDLDEYDVVLHSYGARLCFEGDVSESYLARLRKFDGVKILSVQDEYNRTNALKKAIHDLEFDIVLTCIPQASLDYVYPAKEFPNTEFVTVLTGYAPDTFLPPGNSIPLAERPIFIGYRGRDIGGLYGRLGFDKYEIGRQMKSICDQRGISTDIAMDEESRIYGDAWLNFIGDCRAMLGSESGSNVFDFDGSIEMKYRTFALAHGGRLPNYFEFEPVIREREGEINMGQISPRVFECALMRTPMVLFQGRYSDAIRSNEHYISLEKDFSNVDDVLNRLKDIPALEQMANRAYVHLIDSGLFGYRAFCGEVRSLIERKMGRVRDIVRQPTLPARLHPSDGTSRLTRLLEEQATDLVRGPEELNAKLTCLRLLSKPTSDRDILKILHRYNRCYARAIVAQISLIRRIREPQTELRHRTAEDKRAFLAETQDRIMSLGEMHSLYLVGSPTCEAQATLDLEVEKFIFLHERFLTLSLLLVEKIDLRRLGSWRVTLGLEFSLFFALAKAPARSAAGAMLRRFPKARARINQMRKRFNL